MNIDERRKYIHKMWGHFREANKKEKGELLDEIEAVVGMHRKAIIRLLKGRFWRNKRSRERGREYRIEVDDVVRPSPAAWIILVQSAYSPIWSGWRDT